MQKNGWGLSQMIVYCCIILFFLLVATYLIVALYNSLDDSNVQNESTQKSEVKEESPKEDDIYVNYLTLLKEATAEYLNNTEDIPEYIPLAQLVQEGYIDYLYDPHDNTICSGYSRVLNDLDSGTVDIYLKCSHYISEGYDLNNE